MQSYSYDRRIAASVRPGDRVVVESGGGNTTGVLQQIRGDLYIVTLDPRMGDRTEGPTLQVSPDEIVGKAKPSKKKTREGLGPGSKVKEIEDMRVLRPGVVGVVQEVAPNGWALVYFGRPPNVVMLFTHAIVPA